MEAQSVQQIRRDWCSEGNCPCPVKIFMQRENRCMKVKNLVMEIRENEAKILNCLNNMNIRDMVCQDGNLWCPDNL